MRVEVLTSLYPGPTRPFEGIFAEHRWVGMKRRGHTVTVTHPLPRAPFFVGGSWGEIRRMPRREERAGIPIDRPRYLHVPGRARANAQRFARTGVGAILSRGRPDVVVADYAWPAAAVAPLLRAEGIPCLVSGRGSDVLLVAGDAGLGTELGGYLRAAGHWCAVSEDLVNVMDRLGGAAGHGVLVPNGVDLESFRVRDRDEARRALEFPREPRLVLVVGHLIARKDPFLALDVFARGAPSDALCRFVGRGPLEKELARRIEARGLGPRVQLVGEVEPEELGRWYAAADVLLLTSRREGRPNVVLEALASGRPVLATEAGGTAELLRGFEERFLSRSRDPEELGRMLSALLADPPSGEALRAPVAGLSWESSLEALEGCLRAAVADAAAHDPA